MEEGQKMGGDGFTPGTQRFAFGLFFICLALLAPQIMKAFSEPEPEPPRVAFNGVAIPLDMVGPSACGAEIGSADLVAAIHPRHWKHPNPLKDLNCARSVKVTDLGSPKEKSVTVKLANKCTKGCKLADIALSPAAFKKLSKDATELKVTWDFTD